MDVTAPPREIPPWVQVGHTAVLIYGSERFGNRGLEHVTIKTVGKRDVVVSSPEGRYHLERFDHTRGSWATSNPNQLGKSVSHGGMGSTNLLLVAPDDSILDRIREERRVGKLRLTAANSLNRLNLGNKPDVERARDALQNLLAGWPE